MSQIILSRYPDGSEHVVCGWDAPLGSAFITEFDEFGDAIRGRGALYGQTLGPGGVETSYFWADEHLEPSRFIDRQRITTMLFEHSQLDYPESNVVVDLTSEVAVSANFEKPEDNR